MVGCEKMEDIALKRLIVHYLKGSFSSSLSNLFQFMIVSSSPFYFFTKI